MSSSLVMKSIASSAVDQAKADLKNHVNREKENMKKLKDEVLQTEERDPIIRDLGNGVVVYSNSYCRDYLFYIRNNHALLSLFCSHPLHPYSKMERFFAQLCSFCIVLCAEANLYNVSSDWSSYLWPILISIFDTLMSQAATCGCVQGNQVPKLLRTCMEACGHVLMGFYACIAFIFLIIGAVVIANRNLIHPEFFLELAQVRGLGWLYSLPIGLVVYSIKRCLQLALHPERLDEVSNMHQV
eukprot:g2583.t1